MTNKEYTRIKELQDEAVSRYLDKMDWDCYEWLTPDEQIELATLELKDGAIDQEIFDNPGLLCWRQQNL